MRKDQPLVHPGAVIDDGYGIGLCENPNCYPFPHSIAIGGCGPSVAGANLEISVASGSFQAIEPVWIGSGPTASEQATDDGYGIGKIVIDDPVLPMLVDDVNGPNSYYDWQQWAQEAIKQASPPPGHCTANPSCGLEDVVCSVCKAKNCPSAAKCWGCQGEMKG